MFHVNEYGIITKFTIDRMQPDQEQEKIVDKAAKLIRGIPKAALFLGLSPEMSQITNAISGCN